MKVLMEIEGLKEATAKFMNARREVPDEAQVALTEALLPIRSAMADYPPQPAPADPKRVYIRGVGSRYVPTGKTYMTSEKYGPSMTTRVYREGTDIVGEINSPASYSTYLRGDLNGHVQAWMHKSWELLQSIIDRLMPGITARLESRLQQWADRK